MEQLTDEHDYMPLSGRGSVQHHVGGLVDTHEYRHGPSSPARARQLSEPPTYTTPPPQYIPGPESPPVPAFAQRSVSVVLRPQGAPTCHHPAPVQHHVPACRTIRVPSTSDVSDTDQQRQGASTSRRPLATNGEGEPTSSSDDDGGGYASSTVYPYDSTSTASFSAASRAAHSIPPRPLEEAVVEVHNTCLAATQRYLESLRVNWELRKGREILTAAGLAGPTRRLRDRAPARVTPYPLDTRRTRRALSDNTGLEYLYGLPKGSEGTGEEVDGGSRDRRWPPTPACPIPAPTGSLLQNASRICELIWRRARRDREDVLGAEAGGARSMALLVGSAEAVVICDAAEWEGDPEGGFHKACRAGRDLCWVLGDMRGIERVEDIERGEL